MAEEENTVLASQTCSKDSINYTCKGLAPSNIKYCINVSCYDDDFQSNTVIAKESENNLNTCQE